MDKKLAKFLREENKKLKEQKCLQNYDININGDFTSEYNDIELTPKKKRGGPGSCFPIANAKTMDEAIAIINGYLAGLGHGEDKSYPKFCDRNYY